MAKHLILSMILWGVSATGFSALAAQEPVAPPAISTKAALHGALLVALTSKTLGARLFYSLDGSAPTTASAQYMAPFLVDTSVTVKSIASLDGRKSSAIASRLFHPKVPAGALIWSDEFSNTTGGDRLPNSATWTYDTGNSGFGNQELETYCAAGSSVSPCDAATPNAYVGTDGILHIVARRPAVGVYTSARLKSQGLFSFQYGRVEARMKLPESQGMWPAFWLLGNNIVTVGWPASGELDVMEHINGSDPDKEGFDWVEGSVHGPEKLDGGIKYHPEGFSAADWHTYGMIWSKGRVEYYVDAPANVYASFRASEMKGKWPFEDGPQFMLLNLAVGGNWPGNPDGTTVFPSELLVDYVRLYSN